MGVIQSNAMRGNERNFDLIVFGATSFVGTLLCAYLDTRLVDSGLRWAVAGRDDEKLEALKAQLSTPLESVVADAHDQAAMEALAKESALVISTVGPYAKHGSQLVAAAAKAGTDYCDLTGEPQWMQRMIDMYGEAANSSGARLLHACGFDSIPSDLGVLFTQQEAAARLGSHCSQISMRVKALKGGVSGGSVASMLNLVEEASTDPQARRTITNPYALAPEGMREGIRQPNVLAPIRDEALDSWLAPFLMAGVNTRVVQRSHALMGRPWGADFLYDEATMTGPGAAGFAKATAIATGLGSLTAATSVGPLRKALQQRVLPQPGEGPSPEQQQSGYYDLRFYGVTPRGEQIQTSVTGDRDPGYSSTAIMLAEAAIALAGRDPADLPGGFWTPATAFGTSLIPALQEHAGMQFTVVDNSSATY